MATSENKSYKRSAIPGGKKRQQGAPHPAGSNSAPPEGDAKRDAQLLAATKELEALTYAVSHDLRAPLRSINAFSQLLQEEYHDKLDEQGQEYVRILTESSAQLSRMIEGLLQLSRTGRGEMRRELVDLSALVTNI